MGNAVETLRARIRSAMPPRRRGMLMVALALLASVAAPATAEPSAEPAAEEERFTWFGMYFGSGMLPWYQQPRAGFSFGAGAQHGPGFVAFDLAMGAGPVAPMPYAVAYGLVLGGVVAGVVADGEARPFAAGRIVGGFVVSDAFDPVGIPAPHFRIGGSFGLMVRPGAHGTPPAPPATLRAGRPGGRLSLEPSLALLPAAGLFGFTLELKYAALVW